MQPGILAPVPAAGHYLELDLIDPRRPVELRDALEALRFDDELVVGLGPDLVTALGAAVPGLRAFPAPRGRVSVPSTPASVWLWARADAPGAARDVAAAARDVLGTTVQVRREIASYLYRGGRDLSGYEDGTENPTGNAAREVTFVRDAGSGLDGGSWVAVQQWQHDLARMRRAPKPEMDLVIGRDRESNEELEAAPPSAHVQRTAQEGFTPPAFMLRRSMPWGGVDGGGLVFVAFAASLDPFEAALRRMVGGDDGVVDGLFSVSRPISGLAAWCPPWRDRRLDLRALRR